MGKKKGGKSKKSKKTSAKKTSTSLADPKVHVQTAEEKLWQKRYQISELSRNQHRSNATTLVGENQNLTDKLYTAEKDALEVIAFFKKQRAEKEKEAREIREEMRQFKRDYAEEKAAAESATERKVLHINNELTRRDLEIQDMRMKLLELSDWNIARTEVMAELDELKNDQEAAALSFKKQIETMEEKYNEEKLRQRKETQAEIDALAATAHDAAVAELDKTTQQSFKNVVRLSSELEINHRECNRLMGEVGALSEKCNLLESQKVEAEILARDAVGRLKQREVMVASLTEKVTALETALGHCVREFENERGLLSARTDERTADIQVQLVAAHRALKLKTAENKRIRALAKKVVQQRSETEQFFAESLGETREIIVAQRADFEKALKTQHRHQMLEGAKTGVLPPIQTFGNTPNSTNSVQHRFEGAERLPDLGNKVDISDMTWEQKEQVLRLLFAKMNSPRERRAFTIEVVSGGRPSAISTVRPGMQSAETQLSSVPQTPVEDEAAFFITEGVLEHDPMSDAPIHAQPIAMDV